MQYELQSKLQFHLFQLQFYLQNNLKFQLQCKCTFAFFRLDTTFFKARRKSFLVNVHRIGFKIGGIKPRNSSKRILHTVNYKNVAITGDEQNMAD